VELVNFQVPLETAGRQSAPVVVTRSGRSSAAADVPVFDLQPAVYTTDGTQAIVVHAADYSLVTAARPLQRSEFAFIYAAGLGRVNNPPAAGAASPSTTTTSDVHVSLAGLQGTVLYAGLAPTLVGVYQVNFQVPANAPSGVQNLVLAAGSTSSPTVTVPVQ
jgi:uncharacterized protein (TIGR03437 family)